MRKWKRVEDRAQGLRCPSQRSKSLETNERMETNEKMETS